MDRDGYIDQIETSAANPGGLERLRGEALQDAHLSKADKELISERIAAYLVGHETPAGDYDPEDVPDAGEE